MSLLSRIFGRTAKAYDWRPRAPRVKLTPLHEISLMLGDFRLELGNISTTGMAVYYDTTNVWKEGSEVRGMVAIAHYSFDVTFVVRHLSEQLAGCEFVNPDPIMKTAIANYLGIEILALSLQKVDPSHAKVDPRGKTYWFNDGGQNEFFCVVDRSGVLEFQMTFMGNYVEGGRDRELKSGVVEAAGESPHLRKPVTLLALSSGTEPEMTKLAASFVQHVELLPLELRDQIRKTIQAS